jgi:acyl-CoA synthetase (AMP-forming)/AMP-acid ligase II
VICGGQKISATEVENVLLQHPSVSQAAVVGVPDEKYGELLKAVVVLRAGACTDENALHAHCGQRLAAYKLPRLYSFRDALPTSPAGKVLKRELIGH